jgi:hypothetical protein
MKPSFAGKWLELEIIVYQNKPGSETTNIACFLSYAESRLKK